MTLYDELVARGLIAQVTDEAEIKDLINNGKATFYIGFDPTADSLHGIMLNETSPDGRQQTNRLNRRRNCHDRGSIRPYRHAPDDDTGNDPAQL